MMERLPLQNHLQKNSSPTGEPARAHVSDQKAGPNVGTGGGPSSGTYAAGAARPVAQRDLALATFDRQGASEGQMHGLTQASNQGQTQAPTNVVPLRQVSAPAGDPDAVVPMLMKHAMVLVDAREHRLAINLLRSLLMRAPNHGPALEQMGVCLREEGRYEEALKCFRALRKISGEDDPKSTPKTAAQILIAETLYLSERDDVALATYRDVLRRPVGDDRKLFDIYKNIGNIQVRAGDYESAEEFYNKAFTINPLSDVLMVNYGTLEIQRENLGAAIQRFRRAVELNAENDKGWVGVALVHRQMGDQELAWANVLRAMDINRKNRTAIRLVIDWAVSDHRFSEAIDRLQTYLNADGEDAEMSFTLAKIFTHVGRLPEARLEIERVLALDPATEGAEAVKVALDAELARIAGSGKV